MPTTENKDEASLLNLQKEIAELEQILTAKKRQFEELQATIAKQAAIKVSSSGTNSSSSSEEKIALFRSLFRGREDVYAQRYENKAKRTAGYSPVCRNKWVQGVCGKPKLSCGSCSNRSFMPVTNEVAENHLKGNIVMGVYPMLQNETCYFLAMDFEEDTWREDAKAFIVLKSFDHFFPNQDTMPKGGFGNPNYKTSKTMANLLMSVFRENFEKTKKRLFKN